MPRTGARRVALAAGAAVSATLWIAALARLVGLERSSGWWFAAQTLTVWIYLPAYVVVVVGLVVCRWSLAAVAAPLVVLHLVWVWSDMPWVRVDQVAAQGPTLTLAAVNARVSNINTISLANRLAALGADVVVVTELSPGLAEALDARLSRLPHRALNPTVRTTGAGIYSRFPLAASAYGVTDNQRTPVVRAQVGARSVTIVAVHTTQPLANLHRLERGLDDLAERAHIEPEPVVMAGDFNATRQHQAFRRLLHRSGLRDAHHVLGRGMARTWPVGRRFPPLALIDHVLVDPRIQVLAVDEFAAPGSDHRGVVARLRLS